MHRQVIKDIKFLRERVDRYPQFVAVAASKMQLPMKAKLGDLLVQEGSTAEDMCVPKQKLSLVAPSPSHPSRRYFLHAGTVIAVRQGFPVMELHHGDFFGELGCLLGSLRACSVYALSDCEMCVRARPGAAGELVKRPY
jgi:CRP-like cAMP-binding protein